ncbi:MAG TPA: fumarate reductase/succinate dehydrogenase flavoprotein subunit, partial [Gammaproteobacteria bacterium]|nr:fumarate reductase/succinate dehydrogenase flavoprotein subunit [Gammaproteobacteria bacterium]
MTQLDDITVKDVDVLVIGGGTAGPMAAITAKEKDPSASVMLLEKANVKRSGAISMGMDGLNNAVIPGHATPEQYTKEITIANDGIVLQKGVMEYAERSFDMIQKLDNWGVYFQKDETGEYDVKKVHHLGTYVLPMPEGHNIKKILYRRLRRNRVQVENRYQAIRLMKDESGAVSGCIALGTRDAEVIVIRAKAVVLCTGAA